VKILLTADPPIPVPPTGYGGIERIVDALVRHYRGHGHRVGLVSNPHSTCEVDARFSWRTEPGAWSDLLNARELMRSVDSFRPDVLHSFSRLGYMLPLLPRRLPKVMSYQRHTGGRQIAWAARIAGQSLQFTGCSEFIASMGRATAGSWQAIPNFIEPEKISFVPSVPPDAPLVFLSRVESIKGPDIAIEIAKASGRRLLLAGNRADKGHERDFWDNRIADQIGRDGIEWVGEVNDAQKNELLGRAAALVVPIQWDEPFGIVFAEALAAGTPVITCARGATPEIVEEGRTGFFIKDVADGVAAVRRLAEINRTDCRRAAVARFSCEACAGQYLDLYSRITR
jgi:glycosyltransferase involved in cell wall biosynthesis